MTFADVETARKTYHEKFKKDLLVASIVAIVIAAASFVLSPFVGLPFALVAFAAGYIIVSFVTNQYRLAYRKAYKGYFVEQNLKKIFTEVKYNHQNGFTTANIRESGMIGLADKFHSNDLTIAKYKNIAFAQADVAIIREYKDDEGHTHEYPVFRGRYMAFSFPKKFEYRLEVIGKRFKDARVPGKLNDRKMVRLETESTDFNHNFKIYGDDGFESFYLLAPDVIAKIEDIAVHYDHKLLLGFYNNRLIVAVDDGKDSFEPPKFTKPIDEKAETEKVSKDIKVITDFVDIISNR